jgi:hypothetical protein
MLKRQMHTLFKCDTDTHDLERFEVQSEAGL